MSRLITALLLLATIAQARPEWLYKPTAGLEGEYTEHRVRGFGYGTPEGAIYQGQDRKQAFVDVQYEQVDIETGETITVTVSQPVPAIEAYYAIGMDAPREATGAEMAARASNAAAQAQAAKAKHIADCTTQYTNALGHILRAFQRFAITLPTTYAAAAESMNAQAETVADLRLVMMADKAYSRELEPAEVTGDVLAACIVELVRRMQDGL